MAEQKTTLQTEIAVLLFLLLKKKCYEDKKKAELIPLYVAHVFTVRSACHICVKSSSASTEQEIP